MINNIKIKECKGFTKSEAFADLNFDPDCSLIKGANATRAWVLYGKPFPGTEDFRKFAEQQLIEKTKLKPGYGLHIIMENPVLDNRNRPYTVINNKTKSSREWKFVYLIREDQIKLSNIPRKYIDEDGIEVNDTETDVSIIKVGKIVDQCSSKSSAIERMKELTIKNHKDYSALAVKVPDVNPIAAHSIYTPGVNTKEGRFVAFGIDKNT